MKKCTFILAAAAVSFAFVSCEKKSSVEQQSSGELIEKTFYATQGGKQKTTLDPATLATLWTTGDAIKVYPEAGGAGTPFTLEEGAGTSSATFTGLTTVSDVYVAFYPAANAKSISGSTVTFNIPATQTVTAAGSFGNNTVPMVGYTTDNTLAMKNVGSLFELGLKAKEGTPTVVKIELMGNDGENLAGDFTVDASVSGQPTATFSANGAATLTINCGEYSDSKYQGIALSATDYTYFYISIPAGVFTNGFTAILTNQEGLTAEVTTTNDLYKDAAKITTFEAENIEFTNCRHCLYTEKVTDICNNTYNLVTIGTQTWMAENMRCDKYDTDSEKSETTLSTSASAVYDPYYTPTGSGDPAAYGYYYNWAAAMGYTKTEAQGQKGAYSGTRQGICPNGFHIPSSTELGTLATAAGSDPGKHLKACDGWNNNGNGDNETCFAALPAGYAYGSSVSNVGRGADYWSSDAYNSNYAYYRNLNYSSGNFDELSNNKDYAYSVRCLRN
ncbi:MAG: hypothetical protein MJ010_09005 [Paludibacteraceae bacterium]|nr:hypothetical protein [Paludibacteraceae bacterium]